MRHPDAFHLIRFPRSRAWRPALGGLRWSVVSPSARSLVVTVGAGRWRSVGRRRAGDPHRSRGAAPFTGSAGPHRSARRWRAYHPDRGRGAHRIPPGQSQLRIPGSRHTGLRPSGAVRRRAFGVIGSGPSKGRNARPPWASVTRRMSLRQSRLAVVIGSPRSGRSRSSAQSRRPQR